MRSDPRGFWEIVDGVRRGTEGWQTVDLIDTDEPLRCLARLATIIDFIEEPPIGIEIHLAPSLVVRLPAVGVWAPAFPHQIKVVADPETPAGCAEMRLFKLG